MRDLTATEIQEVLTTLRTAPINTTVIEATKQEDGEIHIRFYSDPSEYIVTIRKPSWSDDVEIVETF